MSLFVAANEKSGAKAPTATRSISVGARSNPSTGPNCGGACSSPPPAQAAKTATARVKSSSSRKSLLIELGEAVYADRTDSDADVTPEIDRLVIELREIDSTTEADDSESPSDETASELTGASQ